MTTIEIADIADLNDVLAAVDDFARKADYTPQMQAFTQTLEAKHREYFDRDAGPSGDAWPALSPVTIARKGHDTILEDTTDLKRSLTGRTGDSVREVVRQGDADNQHAMAFGTTDKKSPRHQTGGPNLPQREHVGMDPQTLDDFVDDIADALVDAIR